MQPHFKTIGRVGRRLGICERSGGIDIRSAPHAFPICHRTASGAACLKLIKSSRRSSIAVIVAGHNDDRFFAVREVPESRQRSLVKIHVGDQLNQQALLFISLWYCQLA